MRLISRRRLPPPRRGRESEIASRGEQLNDWVRATGRGYLSKRACDLPALTRNPYEGRSVGEQGKPCRCTHQATLVAALLPCPSSPVVRLAGTPEDVAVFEAKESAEGSEGNRVKRRRVRKEVRNSTSQVACAQTERVAMERTRSERHRLSPKVDSRFHQLISPLSLSLPPATSRQIAQPSHDLDSLSTAISPFIGRLRPPHHRFRTCLPRMRHRPRREQPGNCQVASRLLLPRWTAERARIPAKGGRQE